ncbi:MAG: hypothetical protein Q9159_004468 [Coniocarpon cinnabarinum]
MIAHVFDDVNLIDQTFTFSKAGAWYLESLIEASCHSCDEEIPFAESVAVFNCRAVDDNHYTKKNEGGIMKIWLQHDPRSIRNEKPTFVPRSDGVPDYQWLRALQMRGCKVVPQWCDAIRLTQTDDMPFPGGFQYCLVEQRLPGRDLTDFFTRYSFKEREEIRKAFCPALNDMFKTRIHHGDMAARNVLWDQASHKIYFVDFESCGEFKERKYCTELWEAAYDMPEWCNPKTNPMRVSPKHDLNLVEHKASLD